MTSLLSATLPLAPVYFVPVGGNDLIGYHVAFPGRGPIGLKLLPRGRQIQVKVGDRWRTLEKAPPDGAGPPLVMFWRTEPSVQFPVMPSSIGNVMVG